MIEAVQRPRRSRGSGRGDVEDRVASFRQVDSADIEILDAEFVKVGDMICGVAKVRALDHDGDFPDTKRFMSLYRCPHRLYFRPWRR